MSNSMLLDIQYVKPNRNDNNPDGTLYVIKKDLDSGEKSVQIINNPLMGIYFEKPEYRNHTYSKNHETMEHLNQVVVPYKDIVSAIAMDYQKQTGVRPQYQAGHYSDYKREMLKYPYVYGADYDIRSYYRYKWLESMDVEQEKPLTKGYLDIEVDSLESPGFADPRINPIDLITLVDANAMVSYTFALHGVDYVEKPINKNDPASVEKEERRKYLYANRMKLQKEFMENKDEILEEVHGLFDENYGEIDYKWYFYTDERQMLVHVFQLIHMLKLDFISIWNIGFDIPFLIERMKVLGLDYQNIMCHPDFPHKVCYFKKDTRNFEVKNKADYFFCSCYTIFQDQMRNYAAIRKGREELRSFSLNYIAKKVINDEKYDYSDNGNIKTISYLNYKQYFIYNIKDVLLMVGIENITHDLDQVYITSYLNATPYESIFKQTVKLRNTQYIKFMRMGYVPGENINTGSYEKSQDELDEEEGEEGKGFEGALVGDPRLVLKVGRRRFGKRTNNIFDCGVDMDMSSFYPSSIIAMNIDPSTLLFKMVLDKNQFDVCGGKMRFRGITDFSPIGATTQFDLGDLAKECIDNAQTGNVVNTMTKWFNLPTVDELDELLMQKVRDEDDNCTDYRI